MLPIHRDDVLLRDLRQSGEVIDRMVHGEQAERTVQIAWGPAVCGA